MLNKLYVEFVLALIYQDVDIQPKQLFGDNDTNVKTVERGHKEQKDIK
jgi:hypothetical protein